MGVLVGLRPPMLRRLGVGRPGLLLLLSLAESGPGDTCSAVVGPESQYPTEFRMPGIGTVGVIAWFLSRFTKSYLLLYDYNGK